MRNRTRWWTTAVAGCLVAACGTNTAKPGGTDSGIHKIKHIVVIYLENRSFDHLYGAFPGAEGIAHAGAAALQVDENGHPYEKLPAFNGPAIDPSRPSLKLPEPAPAYRYAHAGYAGLVRSLTMPRADSA